MALSAEQMANAQAIIEVGRRLGASERDITIALMTASQESDLINVSGGDRDSVGLFQQRDAWGPTAARMSPTQSAYMFFTGGQDGQRGLLDFKTRDQMSMTQAAQAVQVSAFPDAYAKWQGRAEEILGQAPKAPTPAVTGTSENTPESTATQATTPAPTSASIAPSVIGDVTQDPAMQLALDSSAPSIDSQVMGQDTLTADDFKTLFPDAAQTKAFTDPQGGARRQDVISNAMSYIGTPYVWGGTSSRGMDCSGLVSLVYGNFGMNVDRLSADQVRNGRSISYNQLQPGDLVGWDNSARNNGADHVAIYAGNGQIIEAPKPGLAVRRRTLSQHDIDTAMFTTYGI